MVFCVFMAVGSTQYPIKSYISWQNAEKMVFWNEKTCLCGCWVRLNTHTNRIFCCIYRLIKSKIASNKHFHIDKKCQITKNCHQKWPQNSKNTVKSTQKRQNWRYGEGRRGEKNEEHFPLFYQHFIFKITLNLPFSQSTFPILPYNIHFLSIFS